MDINALIEKTESLVQANPVAAAAAALVLLFVLWRWPKFFFAVVVFTLFSFGVMKFFAWLTGATGLEHKKIPFIE
ncbi:MAG: hypothetical protein JSV11_10950 [Nitrospiraceae bacterium]|nr:MAG: hypothetical protein JSU99_05145 [Nitrospiraceae bacterium]UCH44799.1 MAG: hypothetical protein JSV11_10950 [Nitrospiraceae bacterium]